jgi:uncharacterized protein (TIGR02453 family)
MAYFEPAFLDFFKSLAPNNHKDWFDVHRKEYENHVKKPFEKFVGDLIARMAETDGQFKSLRPSDCIFRINRDIRFSQDKTPYKLQMSAIVAPGGRKTSTTPGIYVELTPEHAGMYSGFYLPEKDQLLRIRQLIAANSSTFDTLIHNPTFLSYFPDGILGEKNKALPADLKSAAAAQPLIYNKQYYWRHVLDPEAIYKPDFIDVILSHYNASLPLLNFLNKAVNPA